jgi:hypothetical protein
VSIFALQDFHVQQILLFHALKGNILTPEISTAITARSDMLVLTPKILSPELIALLWKDSMEMK